MLPPSGDGSYYQFQENLAHSGQGKSMPELTAKSFMKLLERSGIVPEDQLNDVLASLSSLSQGRMVGLEELTKHLLDADLITPWHVEKLLAGKYKGFHLGDYTLLRHLGSGGMSNVYLAKHHDTGQLRALKVLPRKKAIDKSYLDRFYQEGRAASSLNHANIARVYNIQHEENTHYMIMEYVQGSDLYKMIKSEGPLPIKNAVRYTAQVAAGLAHAHDQGLVHRDIKPANLLLTPDEDVKILDLGLALIQQDDEESLTLLHNEKVMGTADYLSPEQAVNSHTVDHRADIYSLGCTLYFFLTGSPPFPKGSLAQRIAMHQTQQPSDIRKLRPNCPEPLVAICEHMMMKDPDGRYADCKSLRQELLGFLETGQQLGIGILKSEPLANGSPVLGSETDPDSFKVDTDKTLVDTSRSLPAIQKQATGSSNKRLSKKRNKKNNRLIRWLVLTIIALMFIILSVVIWMSF